MFSENLAELRNLKKQSDEFRQETRDEILSIKEQLKKRDEKWEARSEALETKLANADSATQDKLNMLSIKIKTLEEQEEQRAKKGKRNNIVIKGEEMVLENDNRSEIETKAKEVVGKINAEVEAANVVYMGKDRNNRGIVRVTFKNLGDKLKIMKNKTILKVQDIYIDDDLTKSEREIQATLRKKAWEERGKGNNEVKGVVSRLVPISAIVVSRLVPIYAIVVCRLVPTPTVVVSRLVPTSAIVVSRLVSTYVIVVSRLAPACTLVVSRLVHTSVIFNIMTRYHLLLFLNIMIRNLLLCLLISWYGTYFC
jgi:hypothetical protein